MGQNDFFYFDHHHNEFIFPNLIYFQKHDFVAVYWYARNCRLCDSVLEDLETIDDDAEKFSVHFVKINDKRLAKSYGIEKFPALTFFRDEEMTLFEGCLHLIN